MNVTEVVDSISSIDHNAPLIAGRIFNFLVYAFLVIFVVAFCYVAWAFVSYKIMEKQDKKREKEAKEARRREMLDKMLNKNIEELSKNYLEKFIEELQKVMSEYNLHEELKNKLLKSEELLEKRNHEEELREIVFKKDFYGKVIQEFREEGARLWKKNEDMRTEKEDILKFLEADENNVFITRELSKKQVKVLLEEGYKHSNQFSVNENKIISVLVKSPLNHLPTHTFLVWSIGKLLKKIKGAEEIENHDTRGADITFEYNNNDYAIEVESGSLLRKKQQLREKLAYLNKKYPDKWMFVVSHRKLLTKYRKYGLTSSRVQVLENIKKMLKNSTQIF